MESLDRLQRILNTAKLYKKRAMHYDRKYRRCVRALQSVHHRSTATEESDISDASNRTNLSEALNDAAASTGCAISTDGRRVRCRKTNLLMTSDPDDGNADDGEARKTVTKDDETRVVTCNSFVDGNVVWLAKGTPSSVIEIHARTLCIVPGMAVSVWVEDEAEPQEAVVIAVTCQPMLHVAWYVQTCDTWARAGEDYIAPECVQEASVQSHLYLNDDWEKWSARAITDARMWWKIPKVHPRNDSATPALCMPHVSWDWNRHTAMVSSTTPPLTGIARDLFLLLVRPALHLGMEISSDVNVIDAYEQAVVHEHRRAEWTMHACNDLDASCQMCGKCDLRNAYTVRLTDDITRNSVVFSMGRSCAGACACVYDCVAALRQMGADATADVVHAYREIQMDRRKRNQQLDRKLSNV